MSVNVYNKETDELIRVAGNLNPDLYAKKSDVDAVLNYRESEEQIIGTWFGKTHYRKVFEYTTTSAHTSAWNQTHGIANINELTKVDGTATITADGNVMNINTSYPTASGGPFFVMCRANKTQIQLFNGGWTGIKFKVVLEYTKTTD